MNGTSSSWSVAHTTSMSGWVGDIVGGGVAGNPDRRAAVAHGGLDFAHRQFRYVQRKESDRAHPLVMRAEIRDCAVVGPGAAVENFRIENLCTPSTPQNWTCCHAGENQLAVVAQQIECLLRSSGS